MDRDEFFTLCQEKWETEDNTTQLDEKLNKFYYRIFKKLKVVKDE